MEVLKMEDDDSCLYERLPGKKQGRRLRKIEREWLPTDIVRLIILVESNSLLWDPTHSDYRDKSLRENAFEKIGQELNRSENDCKQKWENLRAQFRVYNAKRQKQKQGQEGGANYKVKWKYLKQLKFLDAVYEASDRSTNKSLKKSMENRTKFTVSLPSPRSKGLKSKADQEEPNIETEKYISKAMELINKKADSAQIFGDYVADRLRQLKETSAELLKESITLLILEALRTERKSDFDSDKKY